MRMRLVVVVLSWLIGVGVAGPARSAEVVGAERLERADGSTITWYLERPSARAPGVSRPGAYPLVLIIQGSECLPVAGKYGELRAWLVSHGLGVLRVEKRGLTADSKTCPEEYLRENTVPGRVLDYVEVVAALRREPRGWDGRLFIVGGSEGGLVAALLAPLVPEARALVMLVSGPDTLEDVVLATVRAQMAREGARPTRIDHVVGFVREDFAKMVAEPTPSKEWGSDQQGARNTWKWWASALKLNPQVALERLGIPVLILQGEDDPATPLSSLERLDARMRELGKKNVSWRRYPGVGHDLTAPLKDNAVLRDGLEFVRREAARGR